MVAFWTSTREGEGIQRLRVRVPSEVTHFLFFSSLGFSQSDVDVLSSSSEMRSLLLLITYEAEKGLGIHHELEQFGFDGGQHT